jgi:hypothetical protein
MKQNMLNWKTMLLFFSPNFPCKGYIVTWDFRFKHLISKAVKPQQLYRTWYNNATELTILIFSPNTNITLWLFSKCKATMGGLWNMVQQCYLSYYVHFHTVVCSILQFVMSRAHQGTLRPSKVVTDYIVTGKDWRICECRWPSSGLL